MLINRRFGDYILIKKIGAGGMAEIFLAFKRGPGQYEKLVALKMIVAGHTDNEHFQKMFQTEAEVAARFNHPHVVQLYDIVQIEGIDAMVLEFMPGHTLEDLMEATEKKGVQLPMELAIWLTMESCEGLHYVHTITDWDGTNLDVVHRDISPQNIQITYNGLAKVFDFGIATSTLDEDKADGAMAGKYAYMSPEQCRGERVDMRSDVFSIGVVLWELTTGQRLFHRDNQILTINAIMEEPVKKPSEVHPNYPRFLERVVMKAIHKDKTQRYANCQELRADLQKFLKVNAMKPNRLQVVSLIEKLFQKEKASFEALIRNARALPPMPSEPSFKGHPSAPPEMPASPTMAISAIHTGEPTIPVPVPVLTPPRVKVPQNAVRTPNHAIRPPLPPLPDRERDRREAEAALDRLTTPPPLDSPPTPLPMVPPMAPQKKGGKTLAYLVGAAGLLMMLGSAGIAGYVLLGDGGEGPSMEATAGSLSLKTNPDGARIFLDGRLLSVTTPTTIPGLAFDKPVIITLEKDNHKPIQKEITLTAQRPVQDLALTLENRKEKATGVAQVELQITPPDVTVYLDNEEVSTSSPALLEEITAGVDHSIRISRDGYEDELLSIKLDPGETREFEVELTPASADSVASLTLRSEPSQARVKIDGDYIGLTGINGLKLPSETPLEVEVSLPGVGTWKKTLVLKPGENRSIKASLGLAVKTEQEPAKTDEAPNPLKGKARLSVSSNPPTQVFLSGRSLGDAPLSDLSLKPGRYSLEFRNTDKGISYRKRVTLKADKATDLNIDIPQGSITVRSDVPSEVFVAGKKVGETPLEGLELYAGTHKIKVKATGAKREREYRIRIREDEARSISASFKAKAAPTAPKDPEKNPPAEPENAQNNPAKTDDAPTDTQKPNGAAKPKPKKPKTALDDEPYPLLK